MVFLDGKAAVSSAPLVSHRKPRAGKRASNKLRELNKHRPSNFLNKIDLLEAKRYVLQGKREKALERFDLSIKIAKGEKLTHEHALACERTGLALSDWGEGRLGLEYLEKTRDLYRTWGAIAKVEQIRKEVLRLRLGQYTCQADVFF